MRFCQFLKVKNRFFLFSKRKKYRHTKYSFSIFLENRPERGHELDSNYLCKILGDSIAKAWSCLSTRKIGHDGAYPLHQQKYILYKNEK